MTSSDTTIETADEGAAAPTPTTRGRALSATVHLFTASGGVLGVLALLALLEADLGRATVYMLVALTIDAVDGSLARAVGVTTHMPQINGRRMDDIVDYLNFVIVPAVFMVQAGSVVAPAWVALPVLASAFGFAREDAKTDDDFFLGFPSYWNVLAFYLWLLDLSPTVGTLWVAGLSAAVFVPWKYVYPSKLANRMLRYFTCYAGLLWAGALAWVALQPAGEARLAAAWWTLAYPAFYMALSGWLGGWRRS